MANKNEFELDGTLFSKDTREVPNKNDVSSPHLFKSIKLEVATYHYGKTITTIPEFQLGRGLNFDDYSIGDAITVRFMVLGRKISDKWYKTELLATYIKHTDIEMEKQAHDNRIARSNGEIKAKDIKTPVPVQSDSLFEDDPDGLNDLPF